MKKIVFSLLVLFSLSASAQVDTTQLRSGKLSLRMNDWEYLTTFIAYNQTYENLYDSIKNRIRPLSNAQYPAGTTIITVDSVSNGELIGLCLFIKQDYNAQTGSAIARITAAVRAIGSTWINGQLDATDASDALNFTNRKSEGKLRLRRK